MTEALAAGSLDFVMPRWDIGNFAAAMESMKIIGIYSRAPKAFTIMTKDDSITSIKDLKGKKTGPKGTILPTATCNLDQSEMNITIFLI